jgi:hypothetical protein
MDSFGTTTAANRGSGTNKKSKILVVHYIKIVIEAKHFYRHYLFNVPLKKHTWHDGGC